MFHHTILARLLLLISVLPLASSGQAVGVYPFDSASFEEYDSTIFDPHSGSGAPYGGFSRATKSRLSKLPLFVPGHSNSNDDDKNLGGAKDDFYMQVTDSQGQPYVCRLYLEDELAPESLNDSMFVPPKLNTHSLSPSTTTNSISNSRRDDDDDIPSSVMKARQLPQYEGQMDIHAVHDTLSEEERKQRIRDDTIVSVQVLLSELEGICGQRHSGDWWSYEWCYEGNMSQFHVRLNQKKKSAATTKVSVEDVSSLGKFHSRTTLVEDDLPDMLPRNKMLGGRRELARVVDEYKDGEICTETGERRKSFVHFMCCSKKFLDKGKGMLHRKGEKLDTTIAALTSIVEDPTCSYNVTICTSLLCLDEEAEVDNNSGAGAIGDMSKTTAALFKTKRLSDAHGNSQSLTPTRPDGPAGSRPPRFPIGSVRDILDKALGHKCLTSEAGPWWSYEFCHTRRIRQFHEEIVSETTSTGGVIMSKRMDTEHILGYYSPTLGEVYPDEDWRLVHNATDSPTIVPSISYGNGAYFEIEYPGGHVCDHTDVTDAAIVAGSAGVGGVERSSSVRYSCGNSYSLSVNEDTTCHYIVHVKLPELCTHPLFMASVAKKQVVKCVAV